MTAPSNVSSASAAGTTLRQKVESTITSLIDQYFKSTLGSEQGIVEYVMALMKYESGFNANGPPGPIVSEVPTAIQKQGSKISEDYIKSSPVRAILANGTPVQKRYVKEGQQAHGIMQVMGWNIVKGASATNQVCEIERLKRPEIAARLLVNAGDSITAKLSGIANLENNILAGLTLLESKWIASSNRGDGWSVSQAGERFNSRLASAVGSYLGKGRDLVTGITTQAYVASIMGGPAYKQVTSGNVGKSAVEKTASKVAGGPTTNGGGNKGEVVGC